MDENVLKTKSFAFALKVIVAYKEIVKNYKELIRLLVASIKTAKKSINK